MCFVATHSIRSPILGVNSSGIMPRRRIFFFPLEELMFYTASFASTLDHDVPCTGAMFI